MTPTCLQTYFFDPEEQTKLRANMMMSSKDLVKEYELKMHIFQLLNNILQHCSNSYLKDFLTINEYIKRNNLKPEVLHFEIDPDEKTKHDLRHKGRFHLPSALLEMSILRPDAVIEEGNRKVVCWVQNPTPEQDLFYFFPDTQ